MVRAKDTLTIDYALSRFNLMNLGKQVEGFEYYNHLATTASASGLAAVR